MLYTQKCFPESSSGRPNFYLKRQNLLFIHYRLLQVGNELDTSYPNLPIAENRFHRQR